MITVIANLKGGTGKSTVNFNLAVWLAIRGHGVRVFDYDPQRTLSDVIEVRDEEGFIPAIELAVAAQPLRSAPDRQTLVDVGTSDMQAMRAALAAAERVLIPVAPSQADVWSTQRFLSILSESRPGRPWPETILIVNRADTHPAVRETAETIEALGMIEGVRLHAQCLYQRTAYRRSFSEGLAVFEMAPTSKAAEELSTLAGSIFG